MYKAKIVGVGHTPFGKFSTTEEALAQTAIVDALEDANIAGGEIDAFYCGNVFGSMLAGQRALRELGLARGPVINVNNACSSSATALQLALQAVESGAIETALVFGVEQLSRLGGGTLPLSAEDFWVSQGLTMPALYAMRAMRYMHDYGIGLETLADVVVKNRIHGALNPRAQFSTGVTREQVLASRPVANPFTLYMCCPSTADGAAAVVVTSSRHKGKAAPVNVLASVVQSGIHKTGPSDMTAAEITRRTADLAYRAAGISPSDVDVLELHDAFSMAELMYYEALGLCGRGEAADLLASGRTRLGGDLVVNPSGGLIAKGHPPGATGIAQVVEICEQLQGRSGARQTSSPRIGLTQVTGGGISGMDHAACSIHILSN